MEQATFSTLTPGPKIGVHFSSLDRQNENLLDFFWRVAQEFLILGAHMEGELGNSL